MKTRRLEIQNKFPILKLSNFWNSLFTTQSSLEGKCDNTNISKKDFSQKKHCKWKPLQYIIILYNLLWLRIKSWIRREIRKPELFGLKLIFLYFVWLMCLQLEPHIYDSRKLDLSWSDQLELFLLNSGFKKPKVEDLNMLSEYNVVFAGMVKNAENTLPELIRQLQIFGCGFKYSHFFVLESNSNDHTRELISEWAKNPGDCNIVHQNLLGMNKYFSGPSTYVSRGNELELTLKHKNKMKSINHDNNNNILKKTKDDKNDNNEKIDDNTINDNTIQKIFQPGKLEVTTYQPIQEFEEIQSLMQRRDTERYGEVREERYVVYRNFLLNKVLDYAKEYKDETGNNIDYLFWVDMDLRGFDIQMIAHEFTYAWRAGFDIVCANGVKYMGWYYDSYASVYEDGVWAYGSPRHRISNRIRGERFYEMKSCFGGLAAYNLQLLMESECKYEHFGWAYAKVSSFARFADIYHADRTCEHLPINFCLRQSGAKLAVASEAHTFYGTGDAHG